MPIKMAGGRCKSSERFTEYQEDKTSNNVGLKNCVGTGNGQTSTGSKNTSNKKTGRRKIQDLIKVAINTH